MKKVLFASTALAGMAIGGMASADIALFGTARLGLGYNINNDGSVQGDDDLRAVSRVRFGVTMTGETDTGITYGATIRADNAGGGNGGTEGQTGGNVFVSGAFGTLTYGDTNAADEQHVGDVTDVIGITELGNFNETLFISNGGGFGSDDSQDFANNPFARPTVRYDYNFAGFGVSASTNRDLTDIGAGASYTFDFGGGSVTGGVGYYDFGEFEIFGEGDDIFEIIEDPITGEPTVVVTPGGEVTTTIQGGEQYSAVLRGSFSGFEAAVVYTNASSESSDLETLNVGLGTTFGLFGVNGYYDTILEGTGNAAAFDDEDAYGAGMTFDLGGGAALAGGVARSFDDETIADFGITLSF